VKQTIHQQLLSQKNQGGKQLAVLIDPDRLRLEHLDQVLQLTTNSTVDYLFVGGSLIADDQLDHCLSIIRRESKIPVVLFPGSPLQISSKADALLLLSLISGRNPELLIGHHVIAAPYLKAAQIEIIPTGYMLVDGGVPTTATYITNTQPIPSNKPDIAACTAMAGEMLGLKTIYLDAGSGAKKPVMPAMIAAVREVVSVPIIVGGGLRTPELVHQSLVAGADLVVVGTAVERAPDLLLEMVAAVRAARPQTLDR
jgi:putative glycerol-1-phosphate prenyltransferase